VSDPLKRRVLVRLQRPLTGDELAALCSDAMTHVQLGDAHTVHCDLGRVTAPDRAIVDVVARLALVARRHGAALVLLDPPADLGDVLDLSGLAHLLEVRRFRGRDGAAGRTPETASRYRGRS
jgi:ABC-type transporter Mla MlaB component